ncbi:MAG: ribosomal RNA small subunit methyltransferase A [Verrucomicrobia bacterium]|nr:ribosomal RNA small subunit methyltransferase A [Verrucomicrobiota bacterium]
MKISEIMSTLEKLKASPRKSLGQNFLHDNNLARWIVECLELQEGEHVLEIGPGLGALTEWLPLDRVSATLLEKDRLFASFLQERFSEPSVEVKLGDALQYDKRALFCKGEVKLVGNLPYYVSTALLFHFSAEPCPISRMVLTVQKEVGDRVTASPRSGEYGSLSVLLQRRWHIKRLRVLPPSVFLPRPEVDSLVIELRKKRPEDVPEIGEQRFEKVVKAGFSERRKKLTNTLSKLVPSRAVEEALAAGGLSGLSRAEELSPEAWVNLAMRLGDFCSVANRDLRPEGLGQPRAEAVVPPPRAAAVDPRESLQVVDEQDRPIRGVDRATVHSQKLLHRAVHILVLNRAGEVFLQRRSYRKDTFPRKWDSSAAGHVDEGESYDACAGREVREELGLIAEPVEIARVTASEKTGQEFISVYLAQAEEIVDLNEREIETGGFFPLGIVDEWIESRPGDFASGFLECYRKVQARLGAAKSDR